VRVASGNESTPVSRECRLIAVYIISNIIFCRFYFLLLGFKILVENKKNGSGMHLIIYLSYLI
jgi:hypothetical protein